MKMRNNPELAKSVNKSFAFHVTRQNEIKLFSKTLPLTFICYQTFKFIDLKKNKVKVSPKIRMMMS